MATRHTVRVYPRRRTRKNGRKYTDWYVIVSLNGKEIETERANPNTEAAAKKLKFEKEQKVHVRTYLPDREAMTFAEPAAKRMEWFEGTTRGPNGKHSPGSYRTRESYLRTHILPRFGHVKLTELAPLIPDFIEELKLKLAGGTVDDIFGEIAAVCKYAHKKMSFPFNPLEGLDFDRPERRSRSEEEIPRFEEVQSILTYLDQPKPEGERLLEWVQYSAIIGLCALGGLRRGEIAGIDAEHLDLDSHWIRVDQQLREDGKLALPKHKKKRGLPMHPILHHILVRYRAFLGKWSGPLFLDHNGERRSAAWIGTAIQNLMKKVGLIDDAGKHKYSTHEFRHFAGSAWIEVGVPIDKVSKYLGHASTAFTEKIYIHQLERKGRDRAAQEQMAGMFPGLAQSAIPQHLKPELLPPVPMRTGPGLTIIEKADDAVAPVVEVPARAAQWIPYAVRLLQAGWDIDAVAKEVGCPKRTFHWSFTRIGLRPDKIRRDAQREHARLLHQNGHNRNQIAKIIKVDWQSAHRWTRIDRTDTDKRAKKAR
jgi:integrase